MIALVLALALQGDETAHDAVWITDSKARTKIADREFHRIGDAAAWKTLWARHAGDKAEVPDVDFEKDTVVAGFFGRGAGIKRLQVQAWEARDKMSIRFGPHVGCGGRDSGPEMAYFFVRVPRTDAKKLIVQQCEGQEGGILINPKTQQEFPAAKK